MVQQRNERISETKALDWLEEIVKILALVHSQNYFHRDIKPANIMLRRKGELVLIDFGTARDMTGSYLQKQGQGRITRISSAGFTPPEQSEGHAVSQSDFFALGRTFAQLLTAKHPFDMYVPTTGSFNWRSRTDNLSSELLEMIDKMMARLPKDRHQNTSELLADIARVRKIVQKRRTKVRVNPSQGLGRRDLLLLLGGSSFAAVMAWENLKPKPNISVAIKEPSPQPSSPAATQTLTSSQNQPVPSSPTPTPVNPLKTQTLNNIITVDSSGNETKRITVQVQYAVEEKISLPSGAKQIELVLIPAGSFTIGSPNSEKQRDNDESPQKSINFAQPFYISRYAVTQAQWFAVMGSDYDSNGFKVVFAKLDNKFKGTNKPIIEVNWNDAKAYCQKLTQLTGKQYRLPTESEWEYSCRANTTTPFYFGEMITPDLVDYMDKLTIIIERDYTVPNINNVQKYRPKKDVGSFPPNAWGLYDTHGNVWEWCEDINHDNYNQISQDGTAWLIGGDQARRMLRGGSWSSTASICRSASRISYAVGSRDINVGFRVAVSSLA
jgi:formylglycine-generating enzyme required for sulfatase activity